jgi:hypothetical protein
MAVIWQQVQAANAEMRIYTLAGMHLGMAHQLAPGIL